MVNKSTFEYKENGETYAPMVGFVGILLMGMIARASVLEEV
jgi:hypothetical protein